MATGWFQRAAGGFGRPLPKAQPQPFEVLCDCGARLTGIREESSQRPSCDACARPVFVLPATTYPVPPSLVSRWRGIEEVDESEPRAKSKGKRGARGEPKLREPTGTATAKPPRSKRAASEPEAPARPWITPTRLIAVAIACALLGLAGTMYSRARWNHAQGVLQGAIDRAEAALNERDYETAVVEFGTAITAMETLKRDAATIVPLRNKQREAVVAAGWQSRPLHEVLSAWLAPDGGTDLEAIAAEGWWLFEADLVPRPGTADGKTYVVDLPLQVGETPVELWMEPPTWSSHLAGATPLDAKRVIFAAQVERGERPANATARVWLKGSTAVLWAEAQTFEQLELFAADPAEREAQQWLLDMQRDFLERQP
jgi:hypothetical protein